MDSPAIEAARSAGLAYEVVEYGRVASAEEAAAARGIELSQLVKTLVIRVTEGAYLLALVPGDRSLDWSSLRAVTGQSRLSLPDADEAKSATGYERGTITPLGLTQPWPIVMERDLMRHELVSIGAGRHGAAINCSPVQLAEKVRAEVAEITKKNL